LGGLTQHHQELVPDAGQFLALEVLHPRARIILLRLVDRLEQFGAGRLADDFPKRGQHGQPRPRAAGQFDRRVQRGQGIRVVEINRTKNFAILNGHWLLLLRLIPAIRATLRCPRPRTDCGTPRTGTPPAGSKPAASTPTPARYCGRCPTAAPSGWRSW